MKYVFKKLIVGVLTYILNGMGYRVLSDEEAETPEDPVVPVYPGTDPENFDLRWLGLKSGTYRITATSISRKLGLTESVQSEYILYTIK